MPTLTVPVGLSDLSGFVRAAEQPPNVEIKMNDGIFIKQILIAKAGTFIPLHSHTWAHTSMLAVGSVRFWCGDAVTPEVHVAPAAITIPAHMKHTFQALEDGTLLFCIHNISRTGELEIDEEHHVVEPGGVDVVR